MGHLPNFGASETVEVPYTCTEMYNGGDFHGYPERQKWDLQHLHQGKLDGRSLRDAASFLQAFLYFGLLCHIFQTLGDLFDPSHFIRENESGNIVVTTRALGQYVLKWREWEMQRSALSIVVLGDSLVKASWEILGHGFDIDWGYSSMLVKRMKAAGWCMTAIHTLTKGQQIHNLYYASTLGPPMVRRDHRECSELICTWEHIKEETFKTQHRPTIAKVVCSLGPPEPS